MTYNVPIQVQDLIEVVMLEQNMMQRFSEDNPFNVTQIRNSGLPHDESIVIVLLSDGFDEDDDEAFLGHENTAKFAMIGIYTYLR